MQGVIKEPQVFGQNEKSDGLPTDHGGDGAEEHGQEVALVTKEDKKSHLSVKKSLWAGKTRHGVFQS